MSELQTPTPDQGSPTDDQTGVRCPTCGHDLDLAPPSRAAVSEALGSAGVNAEMGGTSSAMQVAVEVFPRTYPGGMAETIMPAPLYGGPSAKLPRTRRSSRTVVKPSQESSGLKQGS